jgi:hypothetical protein
MFKLIIIVLLVIGAITTIPDLRNRVLPPLLPHLGPVGATLERPVKKWRAQADCSQLLRDLEQWTTTGKPIPSPGDFYEWARKASKEPDTGKDPWGMQYWLKPGRTLMSCGSNGADSTRDTPDDIVVTINWQQ